MPLSAPEQAEAFSKRHGTQQQCAFGTIWHACFNGQSVFFNSLSVSQIPKQGKKVTLFFKYLSIWHGW